MSEPEAWVLITLIVVGGWVIVRFLQIMADA